MYNYYSFFKKINSFYYNSTSSPKNWKLGCNSCDCIINCFDDALKVSVEDDTCSCGSQLVTVLYKQEKTPFVDGDEKKTGCIFCFNDFMPLIEKHKAVENRRLNSSRGRSSRGRGKGRPNRGRPKPPKDKMAQLAAYFV